jgi:hypothetical protein
VLALLQRLCGQSCATKQKQQNGLLNATQVLMPEATHVHSISFFCASKKGM